MATLDRSIGSDRRHPTKPPEISDEDWRTLSDVVRSETARWCRRNHRLDAKEVEQEAWYIALWSREIFIRRNREGYLRAYARIGVRRMMFDAVLRGQAIVKAGSRGNRLNLPRSHWLSIDHPIASADDGRRGTLGDMLGDAGSIDPDRQMCLEEAFQIVRELVADLPLAEPVIIEERKPAEVAKAFGRPVAEVYAQTYKARKRAKECNKLKELLR